MNLDEYLDKILENVMSTGGIEKVKNIIKEDMNLCGFKYETTKVVEGLKMNFIINIIVLSMVYFPMSKLAETKDNSDFFNPYFIGIIAGILMMFCL